MNVYFDIETIPCQLPGIKAELAAAVTAPGQYKKADSIAAWLDENREAEAEAAWLKTSFDGGLGQVVSICYAIEDSDPVVLHVPDLSAKSEAAMLEVFFGDMGKLYSTGGTRPVLIGHNHVGFDLPFLLKRCFIHNIKPPLWWPRNPKPWADNVQDTMMLWDGNQRAGGSMDRICRLLGIPGKGDMSGADVWPMVQAGRISDVAEYCRGDVDRTRAMFKRLTFADDCPPPVRETPAARPTKAAAEPTF